jgi:hypothetical protein
MTDLEKLFALAKERSQAMFNEDGGITPMFFCQVPNAEGYGVIPCAWENARQKHQMVCLVKMMFKEMGVERFAFVAESWLADRTGDASTNRLPPSQSPNRQECILIHAEEKDGRSKAGRWPIKRDGEKAATGEFVIFEDATTSVSMTFANMFGEEIFH